MAPPGIVLVTSWYVCLVPAVPLIVLRLRSRWKRSKKLGIDDFFFIMAIFVVLGFNATTLYMWIQGMPDWTAGYSMPKAEVAAIMKMVLPSKILYFSAAWLIKFSVVFFYRIFAPPVSRAVVMCYIAFGYLVASWSALFFYTLFGCFSLNKYWAGDLTQCPAHFTMISWSLLTVLNTSTNALIVCLPITMVMQLDMRLRDKFAIGFMFLLGSVVIAASCMQAYYNKQNNTILTATASMVELSAGLIATSLLALSEPILGKNAFQASVMPRRSYRLSIHHREAQPKEVKLLEAFHKEKEEVHPPRYLSVSPAHSNAVTASVYSPSRMSTASKDSMVLPGQFHIGFSTEEAKEDRKEEEAVVEGQGFENITVCVEVDAMARQSRSDVEVKTPGMESWFER